MLSRTSDELAAIRHAYAALEGDVIPTALRIDIHDLLTHYRAVLDYYAQEIAELCSPRPHRPQFLIASISKTRPTFVKELRATFPGLQRVAPKVLETILAAQHFDRNPWLATLNGLVNENKHDDLSFQFRGEFVSAFIGAVDHPYGLILNGTASANISAGSVMQWRLPNGTVLRIRGPQTITVDTPALDDADDGIFIRRTTWTDFRFSKVPDDSVVGILEIIDENLRLLSEQLTMTLSAALLRRGK